MDATENGRPTGGANRSWGVGLPEHHPPLGEGIHVWRLHRGRLVDVVTFDILPAEIIGEEQDDVGLVRTIRFSNCLPCKKQKQEGHSTKDSKQIFYLNHRIFI